MLIRNIYLKSYGELILVAQTERILKNLKALGLIKLKTKNGKYHFLATKKYYNLQNEVLKLPNIPITTEDCFKYFI